jgi:hypothetical protein
VAFSMTEKTPDNNKRKIIRPLRRQRPRSNV